MQQWVFIYKENLPQAYIVELDQYGGLHQERRCLRSNQNTYEAIILHLCWSGQDGSDGGNVRLLQLVDLCHLDAGIGELIYRLISRTQAARRDEPKSTTTQNQSARITNRTRRKGKRTPKENRTCPVGKRESA